MFTLLFRIALEGGQAGAVALLPANVIVASLVTAEPRRRNTSAQPAFSTTSAPVFTNRFDG